MKSTQERKLSMYLVVKLLLEQTAASIINAMPNFATHMAKFNSNVILLQNIWQAQQTNTAGVTANKKNLRVGLVAQTMDIVNKLQAFAQNTANSILAAEIAYTNSGLLGSADTILQGKCRLVHDKALANIANLEAYGITAPILTAFQTSIDTYADAIPKPRMSITAKKQATSNLNHLFTDIDGDLDKMDVLVKIVRLTEPAFYENFNNAQIIAGPGAKALALKGMVKDGTNLAPLRGVTVRVEGSPLVFKTSAKGNFQVKNIAEGNLLFTFEKNGYKPLTLTVPVNKGERTNIQVEMEPL